jgi:Tfp pilus assembly protein PilF
VPFATDRAGRTAAAIIQEGDEHSKRGLYLFDFGRPARGMPLPDSFGAVISAAVSPDGRWIAGGYWRGSAGSPVWDATTWQRLPPIDWGERDLHGFSLGSFSPDGRWLAYGGQSDYRFARVGTWEPGPVIRKHLHSADACAPAFSPDGRLVALPLSYDVVGLYDADTVREVAHLTLPVPLRAITACFSPDGSRLVLTGYNRNVFVWDLRHLREPLAGLDPDWTLPGGSTPPAAADGPPSVTVVGAEATDPQVAYRFGVVRDTAALGLNPLDAETYFRRATVFRRERQFDAALADYDRAALLRPAHAETHYWRGLLRYGRPSRDDRAAAAAALDRAIELDPEWMKAVLLRGSCRQKLGEWAAALEDFDRVLTWLPGHGHARVGRYQCLRQLGRFHEAAAVLTGLLRDYPDAAVYYLWRSECLAHLGETVQAEADRKRHRELTGASGSTTTPDN